MRVTRQTEQAPRAQGQMSVAWGECRRRCWVSGFLILFSFLKVTPPRPPPPAPSSCIGPHGSKSRS